MRPGDESAPTKPFKPAASSTHDAPITPAMPSYPDWSSSVQAFYGAGAAPGPYFASTVGSPTPHPYMWGGQHAMMPPYGTPVPYPALYPPGGIYAHPNTPTPIGAVDGRTTDGKDHAASNKKSKGPSVNHGLIGGNAASGSGNDVGTQSGESGSEGSSDESDDNHNQESSTAKKGSFEQMLAEGASAQNNDGVTTNFQPPVPATNLNIGMGLWNAPPDAGSGTMTLRPNPPGTRNDPGVQNDREIKKQKRKQSNRESARRSRLRKQAECEELQQKVEALSSENCSLIDELKRLSDECGKLTSENTSIKEELTRLCGPEAVSKLENNNTAKHTQPREDHEEGNS